MTDASQYSVLPLPPLGTLESHNVAEGYDTRFAACARLLQSIWRMKKGLPIGSHKMETGEIRPMGSRIQRDVALKGYNFLSPELAKLAKREAAYREIGAVIDEDRLWCNLLSSQPLTLNLFGNFKIDQNFGSLALQKLLPGLNGTLERVLFEHSPGRGDTRFSGDGTAFDVAFVVRKPDDRTLFIGVEVKYSETMRTPKRSFNDRLQRLSEKAGLHRIPSCPELRSDPIAQLFAEHLLAYSVVHEARLYDEGLFVVVYPEQNREVRLACERYNGHIHKHDRKKLDFITIKMETVISVISELGECKLAEDLLGRYINFAPVHDLIDQWQPYT